jgi:recombining binding protein (suppressor of hairless)
MDGRDAPGSPNSPSRYIPSPLHTIVIVEMPPLADVIKALEDDALPSSPANGSKSANSESSSGPPPPPPMPSIAGRSLPLLFIRASDGVGYHSGRTIACENVFQAMDLGNMAGNPANGPGAGIDANWIAAAQAAAAADGGMHGWTLRVM